MSRVPFALLHVLAIMRGEILPRFKAGDPSGAILAGTRACAGRILHVPAYGGVTTAGVASSGNVALGVVMLLSLPIGLFGCVYVGYRVLWQRWRARSCRRCGLPMVRLGEIEDDAHLTPAERTEERLRSVDYDVWLCRCGETQKLRYGAIFTRYAACPSCNAKTKLSSTRTLQSPTESYEGVAQVEERCVHCDFRRVSTRAIARVSSSSDTSSGGGSFDGGGGGGGGGGGSSDGGGSSGSW